MKYKSVVAIKRGGPEVLEIGENEMREPATGAGVDGVTVRQPVAALTRRGEVSGNIVLLAPELLK